MSEILIMGNPRRRRKHKARRSPIRHTRATRRRRRNPESARLRVLAARRGARHRRRRAHPLYHIRHKRRKRNPIGSDAVNILKIGALGAVGGLALDIAVSKLGGMLPAALQSGVANYGVKVVGAIGIGLIADKALGSRRGSDVANGTMAIVLHEIAGTLIAGASPTLAASLGLSGLSTVNGQPAFLNPSPIVGRLTGAPGAGGYLPVMGLGGLTTRSGQSIVDPMQALLASRVPGA